MKYLLVILILISFFIDKNIFNQDIELLDKNGLKVSMQNIPINKDTVLLTLWASWCSPCIKELDSLKSIISGRNIQVVAIAVGIGESISDEKQLIISHQWNYNFYFDRNEKVKEYLINEKILLEGDYLSDKNGKIVFSIPWNFVYVEGKYIVKSKTLDCINYFLWDH